MKKLDQYLVKSFVGPFFAILLIVEFVTDWPSGIILTVMFPVIIFYMILLGRQARQRAVAGAVDHRGFVGHGVFVFV